jgi:formylglycine-generating enzyme required for sulfatase activity
MVPSCPDAASLQRLLDDTLSETTQADLAQHLETCVSCRAALDKLATDGRSLLGLACDLQQNSTPPEPGLQRVLNEAVGAGPDDTQAQPRAGKNEELAFLAPSSRPETLGRLGHYDIQEVIGRGAFGIVLKAFDEQLHRVVAVKVLAPHIASSGTARKRFSREAQAAAAIAHEHVVTIHAVEDGHNPPYLVMHFIAGMSLQEKLDQEGPLALKEILRIGLQTAEGLAAAHKQGLVHRDIKPANILLENGVERVRITDFGLARAMDDASLTQSGVIAGTPMYMSPEQAEGQSIDYRSDLFSLGTVLYVMCTGRPPFRAANTMAVLKRVCEETPRPIREINPEMPDWLSAIVAKLHAKRPEERFQTAKEVAELLGEKLAELQFTGRANAGRAEGGKVPSEVAPATMVAPTPVAPARGSPRSRPVVFAAVVLALAASVIAAVVYWPRDGGVLQPEQKPPVIDDVDKPPPLAVAPFGAAKGKEHQEVWAKHLGVDVENTNSIGMKLALIPPGQFLMGSPDDEAGRQVNEGPQHAVVLTEPFYLGVHDVTVGHFKAFVREQGYQTEAEKDEGGGTALPPRGQVEERSANELADARLRADRRPPGGLRELERRQGVLRLAKSKGGQALRPPHGSTVGVCVSGRLSHEVLFRGPRAGNGTVCLVQRELRMEAAPGWPEEAQRLGPVRHERQRLAVGR